VHGSVSIRYARGAARTRLAQREAWGARASTGAPTMPAAPVRRRVVVQAAAGVGTVLIAACGGSPTPLAEGRARPNNTPMTVAPASGAVATDLADLLNDGEEAIVARL
jgi:hypothetical protein